MLLRSLRPFAQHPRVREIIVALPASYVERPPAWLAEVAGGKLRLVAGGGTRRDSVMAALDALDEACDIVLVHDAARPFVAQETVERVIEAASKGVSAVPAVQVADTLKRVEAGTGRVRETVDRRDLWRAQTPQAFPRAVLEDAYRRADRNAPATDDAVLVEAAGYPVEIVPDTNSNLKVTTPEDFALAESLVRR
jgi:2-C-methyl-D-erythritol 4-phosphate cytidylyltransferase